ncbi:glycine cleavage system protein R [soil metagenome]
MENLVIAVLGNPTAGSINELTKLASSCECNVIESRMMVLGSKFTANMHLAGNWNAIAKFETLLPVLEKKLDVRIVAQRTSLENQLLDQLPYVAYIIALSQPIVLHEVTSFFADQGIDIRELYSESYTTKHTQAIMLSITLTVNVPTTIAIADLRERFQIFCDRCNYDGVMEPDKG